jgi:hypothetical protein
MGSFISSVWLSCPQGHSLDRCDHGIYPHTKFYARVNPAGIPGGQAPKDRSNGKHEYQKVYESGPVENWP